MDLPPPLTRSPGSPPNSYCPSERSSLDYPSPGLVAQHYKISSIYGAEPHCSMAPSMDPDTALPPLDALMHAEWSQPTALQASSTSAAVPSILSTEYDPFGAYESALPAPYGHDAYHSQPTSLAGTPPPGSAHPRSPVPPISRTPLSYTSAASVSHSLAPHVKLETPTSEFNPGLDVSHYPSPRSVHAPYPVDPGPYPATSGGYLSDGPPSAWAPAVESDQFYPGSSGMVPSLAHDRSFRVTRQRRAPRRLTTKEEANFQCEIKGCGKLFSRSYNFKAHMETHDDKREYPFPCPVADCNKKFVRKTDLQRHHQSVHMKERNHRCDFCGRLFARKDTLRRHMDDGCSKRFDIGTLDLRTESYEGLNASARSGSGPMGQIASPAGGLPPLATPTVGGSGLLAPPPLRSRPMMGLGTDHQASSWGR